MRSKVSAASAGRPCRRCVCPEINSSSTSVVSLALTIVVGTRVGIACATSPPPSLLRISAATAGATTGARAPRPRPPHPISSSVNPYPIHSGRVDRALHEGCATSLREQYRGELRGYIDDAKTQGDRSQRLAHK